MRVFLLFTLLIGVNALADTVDSKRVWFNGQELNDMVRLSTEKSRLETRTVTRQAWCTRTEYRRECFWRGGVCRRDCRGGRCRRVCTPRRRVCRQRPIPVQYRCTRRFEETYEVFDFNVESTVQLNYNRDESLLSAGEEFIVKALGEKVTLSLSETSNDYLVVKYPGGISSTRVDNTLKQNINFEIDFVNMNDIKSVTEGKIKDVKLRNGILTFSLDKSFNPQKFIQRLKITRLRRLASNTVLFNRELMPEDIQVTYSGERALLRVDLKKLGISLPKRFKLLIESKYDLGGGEILNFRESDITVRSVINFK